jgi:GNAT superfamily N-acetyltransferase
MDVARLFYFGESVLVPGYRGLGVGHRFFDAREDVARAAGAEAAIFCAVVRPADHVLRPGEARDLHPFWRTRGYAPMEGFTCSLNWKDIDNAQETAHLMQFWSKRL